MNQKRMRVFILGAIFAGALVGPYAGAAEKPLRYVRTETVAIKEHARVVTATGSIQARTRTDLAFRLTGQITELNVKIGDHVEAGQVLAKIDAAPQEADLASAEAGVSAAQAALDQAVAALARAQELFDRGLTTRSKYDQAAQDHLTAESALRTAEAQRQGAANALSYAAVTAPVSGIVTRVDRDVGEVVQAGQPVLTIAHDGPRDAVFDVYESVLLSLAPEQSAAPAQVSLISDDAVSAAGNVREISPIVDPRTGTVRVKVGLGETPAGMGLGALVAGRLTLPGQPSIVIPYSALTLDRGRPAVWLVDPQSGKVSIRAVEIGSYETRDVVLAAGLAPGDHLVVEGGQFLYGGQVVQVVPGGEK